MTVIDNYWLARKIKSTCAIFVRNTIKLSKTQQAIFSLKEKVLQNLKLKNYYAKMSLIPFLLDMERSRRLAEQHLALALTPEDAINLIIPQYSNDSLRNWKNLITRLHEGGSTIKSDSNKFQINLDVQHFAPEEISVKTADGFVIIEAKHEEKRDDHGWVSRQFLRRYALPEGCSVESVQSRLSSDGVLTVTTPLERPQVPNERLVPIIQTGPVKTQLEETKPEGGDGEAVIKVATEN